MNTKLIDAIKDHSGLSEAELIDAGEHGADAGWAGFTYYKDTVEFYDKSEELIWELLTETAEQMGVAPLELVSQFNCAKSIEDMETFKNALAWFALEEAGRYLADTVESGVRQ